MRLTRGADYGTRGIIYLARQPANAIVLVGDIASAEQLSESYLAKIFQELAKGGLVRSHRGAKGGFSLARPPEQITLRQVIEAIEGPIAINRCLAPWEGVSAPRPAPFTPCWRTPRSSSYPCSTAPPCAISPARPAPSRLGRTGSRATASARVPMCPSHTAARLPSAT